MRIRTAAMAMILLASACNGSEGTTTTTSAAPTTTAAPSTITAPSTTGVPNTSGPATTTTTISIVPPTTTATPTELTEFAAGAGVTLSTSDQCRGLTDPIAAGTITWSDGERLWEGEVEGAVTCLFHVAGELSSIAWGPQGDRALVNKQLIVGGPVSGQVIPVGVDWRFTYPTGLNLIGITDGSVIKWETNGDKESILFPITTSDVVAYHPSGLHFAVGGVEQPEDADFDSTEGIFISPSDGSSAVNLILGFDVSIRDIRFANDASRMYFIAEHDGLIHFHSVSTVPTDEEGFRILGAGAEEFADTHATASGGGRIEFAELLIHPTLPGVAAWTTEECAEIGSRGFQVLAGDEASLIQAIGPGSAIGFLDSDPTNVVIAAMSGPCDTPRELSLMSANIETGEVNTFPIAGNVIAAAVRNIVAPHKHDLVDVEIVGFA